MAQTLATIFLVGIILGVVKMILDVQVAKIKNVLKQVERMQILAGIKPFDREKAAMSRLGKDFGVDIEGIEQLAERFQKLAHIKEDN